MTNRQQRRAAERQSQKLRQSKPPVLPFSEEDFEKLLHDRVDGNFNPEMVAHLERVVIEAEAETERLAASLRATNLTSDQPATATPAKDRSRSTMSNPTDTVNARDPGSVLPAQATPAKDRSRLTMPSFSDTADARDPLSVLPAKSNESVSQKSRAGIGGPKTISGKARSSMNSIRHGLAALFFVADHEVQADYDNLLEDLLEEHAPANTTECILVRKMAEHHWLSRRAQTLTSCYIESGHQDCVSLYMRYHTTHERGFYKALNGLKKLQKERADEAKQVQKEFVSQKREEQATEWHEARVRLANARARHAELAPKPRRKPETVAENPLGLSPDQMEELFQDILIQVQTESAHAQAA